MEETLPNRPLEDERFEFLLGAVARISADIKDTDRILTALILFLGRRGLFTNEELDAARAELQGVEDIEEATNHEAREAADRFRALKEELRRRARPRGEGQ